MNAYLEINNIKTKIGVDLLERIASNLNDNEENQLLFEELSKSSSAAIRSEIAYKDKINEETAKILLNDTDPKVLERILRNDIAKNIADMGVLQRIIDQNSEDVLKALADSIESFENISADVLANALLSKNNPSVDYSIASNYSTPKKILKQLLKHSDPDVVMAAKNSLS
jgi:hypothetical protein